LRHQLGEEGSNKGRKQKGKREKFKRRETKERDGENKYEILWRI
jgi:hypothetical protein